jgi:hypothetical protein
MPLYKVVFGLALATCAALLIGTATLSSSPGHKPHLNPFDVNHHSQRKRHVVGRP